jgi:L-fucose isomerase-like protein
MNAQQITLALVPIARTTFDIPLAEQVTQQARAALVATGMMVSGGEALVTSLDEAQQTAEKLAADPPDLVVVFQATFADSTMIMALAKAVDTPLVLWAVPEARTGGRLRLNSLCGINLAGHSLARAGRRYDYIYADPDDPTAAQKVQTVAQAGYVHRRLKHAMIGRIGEQPAGFDTCRPSPEALKRRFGVELMQLDLNTVFEGARAADAGAVDALVDDLRGQLDGLDEMDQPALRRTLGTYLALRAIARQEELDGFALRCWPEFFTNLGCAACGSSSMLNNAAIPCSCETDVNGTVTQLMLQWLSGEPALGTDVVSFDTDNDSVVVWHCGKAPLAMADPESTPRATIHSNRELPLLMEFPLKPGRVTLARLSEATGSYRLVIGSGEMLRAPLSFTGTSGVVRFDRPASEVLDTMLSEGLEHHLALTYGDYVPALLALADLLEIPVLRL